MPESNLQVDRFQWHFGVVENRDDPLQMGRLQVRWFNVHSDDISKQPTSSLPWATPIFPIHNASTSGVGGPWTGAVEGSFVMGFFIDTGYQKPFIMGSIAGIPTEPPNIGLGFNDPFGTYPKTTDINNGLNESDLSRLSRDPEGHESLINRRVTRETGTDNQGIPTATAPSVKSVLDNKPDTVYEEDDEGNKTREYWHEPHPTLTAEEFDPAEDPVDDDAQPKAYTQYPYNHVWETESGHVFEVDDTPNHERIHNHHRSGTFEEIKVDGSKTVVVVGDGYEINVKDKNVLISGTMNLTVYGDCKTLIKGNKYEEIDGDSFVTIRGDRVTKIGGNEIIEILSDRNTQLNGNNNIRITGNDITSIEGSETISVGSTHTETITDETNITYGADLKETTFGSYMGLRGGSIDFATPKDISLAAGGNVTIRAVNNMILTVGNDQTVTVNNNIAITANNNMTENITGTQTTNAESTTINNDVAVTGTVDASTDVLGGEAGISLVTHTHTGSATAPSGAQSDTGVPK